MSVIVGDCLEVMPMLEAGSVDLVLSDLPYGKTQNWWDAVIPIDTMFRELNRVTKQTAAIVLMAAQPFASDLIYANRKHFRYDLIWRKNKPTGFLNAKKQPLRNHEHILVFYRSQPFFEPQMTSGHKPVHSAVQASHGKNYGRKTRSVVSGGSTERYPTSVIDMPIINNDDPDKRHPTQKPVALMEWLIRSYSRPGDVVLDPAMGSGTTGVAARNLDRNFIGIEKIGEYAEMARRRLGCP